jgi:hypothetical protein
MSVKEDYSPEEWNSILTAPYYASMLIVVSDFNLNFLSEVSAMMQNVVASVEGSQSEFIRQVAADFSQKDNQESIKSELEKLQGEKDPAALKDAMLDYVRSAVDTAAAKSQEDSQTFSQWLVYLAQKTADASKEGGFLGFGAVRVSEQEQAALDELADTLGVNSEE